MPTTDGKPRFDAMLQARVTVDQLQELRSTAADLGVEMAVLVRAALRRGLEPARQEIATAIDRADAASHTR